MHQNIAKIAPTPAHVVIISPGEHPKFLGDPGKTEVVNEVRCIELGKVEHHEYHGSPAAKTSKEHYATNNSTNRRVFHLI